MPRQMQGRFVQPVEVIRRGQAFEGGLQQALGQKIGVAAVGGRRMGVVLDREAEMPQGRAPRNIRYVFPLAQQLDHGQGYRWTTKAVP